MNSTILRKSQFKKEKPVLKSLPSWFRQRIPDQKKVSHLKNILESEHLHTVCQSAHCPNLGQCWSKGVATFMILGEICTRSCRFCSVKSGQPLEVDSEEPERIAQVVKKLQLKYVVVTSVTRDDLSDKGVGQFVKVIQSIRRLNPLTRIEVLIPDFDNEKNFLKQLVAAKPDVIGHNIEMVQRFFKDVRPQASYQRSLSVLKNLKNFSTSIVIKSGFMVGLGETNKEVYVLLQDLYSAGCDLLTIGQYLAPSATQRHIKEKRFVSPQEFEQYQDSALKMGFRHVFSGPLVRSSYLAEENFLQIKDL